MKLFIFHGHILPTLEVLFEDDPAKHILNSLRASCDADEDPMSISGPKDNGGTSWINLTAEKGKEFVIDNTPPIIIGRFRACYIIAKELKNSIAFTCIPLSQNQFKEHHLSFVESANSFLEDVIHTYTVFQGESEVTDTIFDSTYETL